MTAVLEARSLEFAYGPEPVLSGVDFALHAGELVALVGPNGAGKSTLLKLLLGWLAPGSGEVIVEGAAPSRLSRRDIARKIAFVPQDARVDFEFTVRELVAMGRTPHLGRFQPEGAADLRAIERALEATETGSLEGRIALELSGGERQRVHLARALAQETAILLLDEPTASLDIEHQLALLALVRRLTREGRAVLVAMHDLSLAARFADRAVVLASGKIVAEGPPEQVFTEAMLEQWFRIRARVRRSGEDGSLEVIPLSPLDPLPAAHAMKGVPR